MNSHWGQLINATNQNQLSALVDDDWSINQSSSTLVDHNYQ